MKDRERVCEYYINEGNCKKRHKGTFYKTCQYCKDYSVLKNSRPRRGDYRKKKKDDILKKENNIKFYI